MMNDDCVKEQLALIGSRWIQKRSIHY